MIQPRARRRRLSLACLGIVLVSVSPLSTRNGQRASSSLSSTKKTLDEANTLCIHYSYSFQRHLVYTNDKIVASYEFLDDARAAHPTAIVGPLQGPVAGAGLEEPTAPDDDVQDSLIESICDALDDNTARVLRASVPVSRWAGLTPEIVRFRYQQLDSLLQTKLQLSPGSSAASITNNFPHVLLYDPRQVEERLDFLLAPLDRDSSVDDWPLLASKGYGAGWTVAQLRQALQSVPHVVLAMYLEDAAAMKPSLFYFLSVLRVSYPTIDQVRLQLDQWIGGDIYTFAYLHEIGIGWPQLSVTLQAFPCLCFADTEPTWEMLGHVRTVLKEDALHYLQRRLQVRPSTVQAMIKTHAQLSTYSIEGKIEPTLNALQSKVGFSSSELRKVILRMPSLVGMSIDESSGRGLMQRLQFFHHEVGMTQSELRKAVIKQPSLLQYSVDNSLRPKLDFFVDELCVPWTEIPRMITRQPSLMGLSLKETLRPTATALMERCGLEPDELGSIISRAPNILTLSWKRNMEPTLDYLRDRLGLSKRQLKDLVFATPRVLMHSIKSSLEPKLQMVQVALEKEGSQQQATRVVAANPSLLVTSNSVLQQRLQSGLNGAGDHSVAKALQSRSKGTMRGMRPVLEMDAATYEVIREYSGAKEAAKLLGTSVPNMYNICKLGRLWKGKKYTYGSSSKKNGTLTTFSIGSSPKKPRIEKRTLVFKNLRNSLRAGETLDDTTVRIIIQVSGRVYPPDDSNQVRGMRRAGGIALYFPQIDQYQHGPELPTRLRLAAENSFGQIMPADQDGSYYNDGRILSGFPYLRPSRNRCELYACHDALKVVNQLLKYESTTRDGASLKYDTVHVDIYTDSDYAWKLLHNTTRLLMWGEENSRNNALEYNNNGSAFSSRVNPDLLHPLTRTYFRLVEQQDTDGQRLELGKNVIVSFHHAAGNLGTLHDFAKKAAIWMYQRGKQTTVTS